MTHGATHIYERTVANGEALAGLRVDIGSLEATLHKEVSDLKVAVNLQGDRLRQELGDATPGFRADVTGLRELMDARFQKVDGQFNAIRADTAQRFNAVDQRFEAVDRRFDGVDQRLDTLDAKLDTLLSELRKPTD
jgi:hypothetical protein